MGMDWSSIEKKLDNYYQSDKGQKAIKNGAREKGRGNATNAASEKERQKLIKNLFTIIQRHARDEGLPSSIRADLREWTQTGGIVSEDNVDYYKVEILFKDLSRPSLAPTLYDGVENIVALFDFGYSAKHTVTGYWESHDHKFIHSRKKYGGNEFITDAIDEFYNKFGEEYSVSIDFGAHYYKMMNHDHNGKKSFFQSERQKKKK